MIDLPEELQRKFPAFHVDKLCPYCVSDEWEFPVEPKSQVQPEPEEFTVDSVLDVDLEKEETTLMFKIKWAAPYNDDFHNSWVPLSND